MKLLAAVTIMVRNPARLLAFVQRMDPSACGRVFG